MLEQFKTLLKQAYSYFTSPFLTLVAILLVLCIIGLILLLIGWIISSLWNWLMPTIFTLPQIGVLQGLGLYMLSSALFK